MGEMADWAEDMAMQEMLEWEETVDEYLAGTEDEELIEEARELLQAEYIIPNKTKEVLIGILSFWRGYQRLTDKQRNALAKIILAM